MTGPGRWVDEGPATPYSGPRARIGGTIVVALARKPPATWIPTAGDVARQGRSHAAYVERQRRLRLLTTRQIAYLEAVERHAGNRSQAARDLLVTPASVQHALRLVRRAGVSVPPIARRGPDLRPRTAKGAA